ncbi:transketolase [Telmatobacter bradus]|uniref:transketolase n=1 Tax=Telmatobacter bradus TaxID=474953 RepID=UPI003B42B3CA
MASSATCAPTTAPPVLDKMCINTLRFLAVDMVQKANSGHPGLPMGSASMAYALWDRSLKFNPHDPHWPDRDRFILSAGHGCALLYALLHVTGFELPLEELKNFRQWGSRTPGHPEYGKTPGVEATTGPLGQGLANGVGMAIAEMALGARFNRPGHQIVDHYTYVLVSDGDLEEGISSEAGSIAGHQHLGKLIVLYADNHITIEGSTELTFTEDRMARFAAFGWHVQRVEQSNDVEAVALALNNAREETGRPSLIAVRTHIGFGSPHKQDTAAAHGEALGVEEVRLTKEGMNWPVSPSFHIPEEALDHFRKAVNRGSVAQEVWKLQFKSFALEHPKLAEEFQRVIDGHLPQNWDAGLPSFTSLDGPMATRVASGNVIDVLVSRLPEMMGGSADLGPSTHTDIHGAGSFEPEDSAGRNMHFGIRENAMGAILNGMALHRGLIPFGGTFFVFCDYMRPPIRLAAMNALPVIYIFTHDSIGMGEDGPTHQPVEQLIGLRSIPGMTVLRPADANETVAAWRVAIGRKQGPVALVLTRQSLPVLDLNYYPAISAGVSQGGYILADFPELQPPEIILIATGSEVHLAIEARNLLLNDGVNARVVSMPSTNLFALQSDAYREKVLPTGVPLLVIEAGSPLGWQSFVGPKVAVIGIDTFGSSAPGPVVMEHYGFTVENVCRQAHHVLDQLKEKASCV